MGWTFTHKPQHISAKQFIESNVLTWTSTTHKYRVIDGGVVKFRTYYGAVERTEIATGKSVVFAVVILLHYVRNDYHNFGYKELDESMGPNVAECPPRILDLLSPTTDPVAHAWRVRCLKNIGNRKIKLNITVGSVLKYGGRDYTVLQSLGRRGFSVSCGGQIYRMRTNQAKVATIVY